ncbi:MAG: glucosaminidase domain-containing protein [Bacteroidota bacterium]
MYRFLTFILIVCFSYSMTLEDNSQEQSYITNYSHIAVNEMYSSKIPASIILAQGMIESNCGQSSLASKANNHFGIKCKDWGGPTFFKFDDDTDANGKLIKSCFRVYDTSDQSYRDHSNFLLKSDRYAGLFAYNSSDYKNWANGLQACGYATDKSYANKLINIIERYQLYIYDVDL